MIANDLQIISQLKIGDRQTLKKVYLEYKVAFFNFASRYDLGQEALEDVYQDVILVINEKALSGKMDELSCSLKTYVFSVGKYMVFEKLRKKKRVVAVDSDYVFDNHDSALIDDVLNEDEMSPYQQLLYANFSKLSGTCQELIKLFYYQGLTIEEIVEAQGYDNKNVVKSQKSRCLRALKDLIKNNE